MLLPDETYEQALCPKNNTTSNPTSTTTSTTKKIIELSTPNFNNPSINKVPSSVISVSNIKRKIKKSSLLKSSIINTTKNKSSSTVNLNGIISKDDQEIATNNIKEISHHITTYPEFQSDTKIEQKKLSIMINHYSNYNITSSSSSTSSSSPTSTASSLFDYEDVVAADDTNDVLSTKKILSLSTNHIINDENVEILNEQQKRRSSIASYDRTSDFFNHIPDFIGEALNPFSIKNLQQQKQLQKKKEMKPQHQQQQQRIVKFKNNDNNDDDVDINMNNKNNGDIISHNCHQQRNSRRQQKPLQQNIIPKVTIVKNCIGDNNVHNNLHNNIHNNNNNQFQLHHNNGKIIYNNDNNNNKNVNENSSDGSSDYSNNNNDNNNINNDNLNFNNNNNHNNNINSDREFDSFHNSSDILKICEEFLWRYRIRPDFFCKYHKALSNSTNSSPKSRSITKQQHQQQIDLNQSQKLHQTLNDSQQQQCNKKISQNNNNSNKVTNNVTNLKQPTATTTTTLLIQQNQPTINQISQKSSNLHLNNIINQQMNPLGTVNHPVVKMKRFRKATAIYTLPTRPSKKGGSISSSTDASSSNEAVHLQQRLKSLSTELVTLRNRLHVGQTGTGGTGGGNTNANSGTTTNTTSAGGGGSGAGSGLTPSAPLTGLSLNINSNNGNNGATTTQISTNSILQSNCNTGTGTGTTGQSTNTNISGTKTQSNLNSYNQISNSGTTQQISNTINSDINSGGGGGGPGANNIRNSNISVNKTYPLSIPPGANSSSGVGNSAIISSRNTSIPLPLPHHVVGSLDARCETLPRRSLGILNDIHSAQINGTTQTTTAQHTTSQHHTTTQQQITHSHSQQIKSYDAIISHTTKPLTFDYVNGNSNGQCTINGINNGINNGTITNCSGNFNIITATTKTIDNGKQKKPHEMDDLIHLTGPLTEDAVMRTLHSRFNGNQYFTNVGPILLSINPYHDVGNPLTLSSTRTLPLASQLRRIVQEAVRQQAETGYPQAIILSGTSGAGKTHCSMLLLRQLFAVAGGGPETDAFKHLAAAFTVLRSLGSAKTTTNSESSRIGQFIEVQVTDGALYRTKIHCYFLDQTRVVRPLPNEKNYHIFYQMLAGLSREERIKLNLEGYTPSNLRYLQNGDTHQDEVEDSTRFQAWKTCLGILGIPFLDVVRVLAAVLLLGNVQFVDGQGLEVDVKGEAELNSVAGLLGVPPAALFRGLTTRTHNARGQLVKSVCDANMSNMTRDCLAKALYCRTVATIVRRANSLKRLGSTLGTLSSDSNESVHNQGDVASQHASTIGGNSGSKSMAALNNAVRHATDGFIGILDMFGFEEQSPAQLEHLCINLCAETMQHFYNTHIFKSSVESCRDEGILCDTEVDYVDNVPCIDLISSLRTGLLSMLDAECSIRGTAESYVAKIKVQHRNSTRLETKQTELHDPRMFTIRHFAGKVEYDATEFLDTNRDVVPDDLVAVFYKHTCNFGFATHLFGSELKALYAMENVPRGLSFRIAPTSHTDLLNGDEPVSTLTQDFHTRLDNLLRTLVHARPHFVRCIRSNSNEIPGHFERMTVVKQIRALQVLETVNLMASGFPHRMRFKQFTARYKLLAPFRLLRRCEEKALEDCDLILQYAMENLPEIDGSVTLSWAPGKRHVFLSEGIRQHLENLRSDVRTKSATLIQATWRGWQLRKRIGTVRRPREIISNSTKLNKSTPNAAPRISSNTTGTTTRPRPQPIAGTPPPDPNEKCDSKIIQQTCTLFGLDLERPPPVPPSRPYTVTGNSKLGYPQTRIMKMNFPEDSITNPPVEQLKKGETVTVVGASHCRGHLIVEHKGQSFHVPFQYMSSPWKISKCMD